MKAWMLTLFSTSLCASILCAAVLLLAKPLSRRYSARALSAAFLTVLSVFLVITPSARPAVTVALPQPAAVFTQAGSRALTQGVLPTMSASPAAVSSAGRGIGLYELLALVWGLGAAAALLISLLKHFAFLRAVKRWKRAVSPHTRFLLNEAARELHIRRAPRIALCPIADGPLLYGLVNPCILLPQENMSDETLAPILKHELSHLTRLDLWRQLLALATTAMHWFNPLVYMAAHGQSFYAELACDETATNGICFDGKKSYAVSILNAARGSARTSLSTGFKGGKKQMRKRMDALLSGRGKRVGRIFMIFCLAAAVLLSGSLAFSEAPEAYSKAQADVDKAFNQYTLEYGDFSLWPAVVKGAYTEFLLAAGMEPLDGVLYVRPGVTDLPYKDALALILSEMKADNFADDMNIQSGLVKTEEGRVWYFTLEPKAALDKDYTCTFRIASPSGRIISANMAEGAAQASHDALAAQRAATGAALTEFSAWEQIYGTYIPNWPQEIKAEYDALQAQYQMNLSMYEGYTAVLPQSGEMTAEEARSIADAYVAALDETLPDPLLDAAVTLVQSDADQNDRRYIIEYRYYINDELTNWQNLGRVDVLVEQKTARSITLDNISDTLSSARRMLQFSQLVDEKGMWITWPVDEIIQYKEVLGLSYDLRAEGAADEISREEALEISYNVLTQQGISQEEIAQLKSACYVAVPTEIPNAAPYWVIYLYTDEMFKEGFLSCHECRINARNGGLIEYFDPNGNG